jgi:hypothetical protein
MVANTSVVKSNFSYEHILFTTACKVVINIYYPLSNYLWKRSRRLYPHLHLLFYEAFHI